MLDRIGVTGAPGCGVTTLGKALAGRIAAVAIDTDDHHFLPTEPPFQEKRPVPARRTGIAAAQALSGRWVLSGTLDAWAEGLAVDADLIVFLEAPTPVRMDRLRRRQEARFGAALLPGGAMHGTHAEFIAWAERYEIGDQPGRSRPRHERWLARLETPVLRLDATRPVEELVGAVLAWDATAGHPGEGRGDSG